MTVDGTTLDLILERTCPETGRAEAFLAGASRSAQNIDVVPPVERIPLSTGGFGRAGARYRG